MSTQVWHRVDLNLSFILRKDALEALPGAMLDRPFGDIMTKQAMLCRRLDFLDLRISQAWEPPRRLGFMELIEQYELRQSLRKPFQAHFELLLNKLFGI